MDAEKLLSDLLNNELLVEMSKGLYESLEYDEPTVNGLTKNIACRLENEWYRRYNGWNNEKVHCKIKEMKQEPTISNREKFIELFGAK